MSRILITSIGSGSYDKETKSTNYRPADYYLGNEEKSVQSAYIYDALKTLRGFDKMILVGTCGSQWYALYDHLYNKDSAIKPITMHDDEYTYHLLELLEEEKKWRMDPEKMRQELEPLKASMGSICAEIIVLKYGLNDEELLLNFELMTKISEYIRDGDELSFDITHSFRSLAFFELLAVNYLKETLGKKISLDFVSYGMFDIAKENGQKSPIVDLSHLVKMMDWIKASEEYNRYGTTGLLADLMEREQLGVDLSKEEKKALRRLGGEAISTNDLCEFKNLIRNCNNIVKRGGNLVLSYIFSDLSARFSSKLDDDMLLQAELSKWHFEKGRYINSVITLVEATIKYCADLIGADVSEWNNAHKISTKIRELISPNSEVGQFRKRYNTIHAMRNKLAHAEDLKQKEILDLEEYIKGFYSTYERQFKNHRENEEALRKALQ
jgi:CRISPR-associated Csx2 family protein